MAETVTFDEFGSSFQGTTPFSSGSLTFSSSSNVLGVWTSAPSVGPFNGTPYLLDGFGGQMTMNRTDLGDFTLNSFEMALGWYQPVASATVTVTYYLAAGGTSTASLALDTSNFATFTPGVAIKKATFDLSGAPDGYISLDNINVNAVPEPGTWALMIGGLAVVGGMARRRRA